MKRDGRHEPLDLAKLRRRFEEKGDGLNMEYINFDVIVAKLAEGIYQGKRQKLFLIVSYLTSNLRKLTNIWCRCED